jgi:hypothetical protein
VKLKNICNFIDHLEIKKWQMVKLKINGTQTAKITKQSKKKKKG